MINESLINLTVIIFLPLMPAVILYGLFGHLNKARTETEKLGQKFTLGGPIAAYFVILTTCYGFIAHQDNMAQESWYQNIIEKESLIEKIIGDWQAVATYQDAEGIEKTSTSRISINKGRFGLYIQGQFGPNNSHWKSRQVFLDENQLSYVFYVPTQPGQSTIGITVLDYTLNPTNNEINEMFGDWGVIASKICGKAKFTRL